MFGVGTTAGRDCCSQLPARRSGLQGRSPDGGQLGCLGGPEGGGLEGGDPERGGLERGGPEGGGLEGEALRGEGDTPVPPGCVCDWVIKGLGMSSRVCVTG